jgi:hypothetical protein
MARTTMLVMWSEVLLPPVRSYRSWPTTPAVFVDATGIAAPMVQAHRRTFARAGSLPFATGARSEGASGNSAHHA